jgi:hypothetical protein
MDDCDYRIIAARTLAENLQLHVFVRAYRDAWIALYSQPPVGTHSFARLGVSIRFKEPSQAAGRTPD